MFGTGWTMAAQWRSGKAVAGQRLGLSHVRQDGRSRGAGHAEICKAFGEAGELAGGRSGRPGPGTKREAEFPWDQALLDVLDPCAGPVSERTGKHFRLLVPGPRGADTFGAVCA